MSFFLTDEQEDALNLFLDEENKKVCEDQLSSGDLPDDLSEIIKKTIEAGSPIPAFDPLVGYYTVSFTPSSMGNRIYAHHHLSNVSVAISDPLKEQEATIEDDIEGVDATIEEPSDADIKFVEDYYDESLEKFDPMNIELNGPPEDMTLGDIVSNYGSMPQELLEEMGVEKVDDLIEMEKETVKNQ